MDVSGPLNPGTWPFRPGYIGSEFPWAPEAAGGPAWGGRLWRSAVSVLGPVPVGALSLEMEMGCFSRGQATEPQLVTQVVARGACESVCLWESGAWLCESCRRMDLFVS